MAIEFRDRVLEFCHTTGTGPLTLVGSTNGFRTAAVAFGAGDHESYWICAHPVSGQWEMFRGTVNGTALSRDEVLSSSNAGALVDFGTGRKEVRCTLPAEIAELLESSAEALALVILKDGSVAFAANQSLGGHQLTDVADPTDAQDAATKAYVDAEIGAIDFPDPDGGVLPPESTTDQAIATWNGSEGTALRDNPNWTIKASSQKLKAKCRYIPRADVVSGATPNIDCNGTDNKRLLLTANAVPTVSNATIDQFIYLRIRQDATGGRTLDWSGVNVQWVGDDDHVMTSTAEREDAVMLHCVAIDGYGNPAFLGYVIGQNTPIVDSWS